MNKLVFSLVSLLLSAAFSSSALAADAEAGEQKAAVCAACHGADGNSSIAENPKLAGQNANYLVKQMLDIKEDRREVPLMEGMLAGMDEADLEDIAAFYAEQEITLEGADPDLVEQGRQLYRSGIADLGVTACSACHSPTGKGNAQAGFPALGGQHAGYTDAQMRAFRSGERDNDGRAAMMRTVSERLTDSEIEALSSYISGLSGGR
ncbi:MAG: c-type cytochrome [Pseudohongiellaceae bacterium]